MREFEHHIKDKLIERTVDKGADINSLISSIKDNPERTLHSSTLKLLSKLNLDPNALLKLALNYDTRVPFEVGPGLSSLEEDTHKASVQKWLVGKAIKNGADLKAFSLKDFDIMQISIDILNALVEYGFNPNALLLRSEGGLEAFKLAEGKGAQFNIVPLVTYVTGDDPEPEVFSFLIKKCLTDINQRIGFETYSKAYEELGDGFKEFFEEAMADLDKEGVDTKEVLKDLLAYNGTILHILVKNNKLSLLKSLLGFEGVDVNSLNDKGQTPIFLTQTAEVADLLINNGADLEAKDQVGNTWISTPSLEIINYAVEKDYLPKDFGEQVFRNHFNKGNFEHAKKITEIGIDLNKNLIIEFIDALENGLKNSVENNKYHAIANLIHKAGIKVPNKLSHLVYNFDDHLRQEDFLFISGLAHKLAAYYILITKKELLDKLEEECGKAQAIKEEIDRAFSLDAKDIYSHFLKLKDICPSSKELSMVENSFDAYYQVLGKALAKADNDFALEVLVSNGMPFSPLEQEIAVFRGMKANIGAEDINSWFKYGQKAFSIGMYQKLFGYYVNQPWNEIDGKWELGGTYVSLEPATSALFAGGATTNAEAESIFMEMRIPKGSPKICGAWKSEYELVPNSIEGKDVIAVYKLAIQKEAHSTNYLVVEVIKNPYIENDIKPRYEVGEFIVKDKDAIEVYNSLGCLEFPTDSNIMKSLLYKDYDDFISKYTIEQYLGIQDNVTKDYYEGRLQFDYLLNSTMKEASIAEIHSSFFNNEDCNPELYCC